MAEDGETKPQEPAPTPASSVAPPPEPEPAPVVAAETAAKPAAPPNKLHEWGAAILIMVVLSAILAFFLSFMRGTSF